MKLCFLPSPFLQFASSHLSAAALQDIVRLLSLCC